MVTLLLDAGAGANSAVPIAQGETGPGLPVLYFACERGNAALTRVLLEAGADPNDGESIYHAAQFNRRACLELLLAAAGGDRAPLGLPDRFLAACHAAAAGAARNCLAEEPGLLTRRDVETRAQLENAAGRGNADAVRLMLEPGFPAARRTAPRPRAADPPTTPVPNSTTRREDQDEQLSQQALTRCVLPLS